MKERVSVDLTKGSFDDFVGFLFAHDAFPDAEPYDPWYWNTDVLFTPSLVCDYYVRLFSFPSFLLDKRFSKAQLEEGFWAIQAPNLDCSASNLIWSTEVSVADRQECVTSMYYLFRDLFSIERLDTAAIMWWDSLCYDWHCGNRKRERGGEDEWMQDVMFQTLVSILGLESEFCQSAALHGLGHLHHPQTAGLVQNYLKKHPSLSNEQKEYALTASRFQVL